MITLLIAAGGAFLTGNDLLARCETNRSACINYVLGVSDALSFFEDAGASKSFICTTTNVTAGQMTDVVIKYLKDNPAVRNQGAAGLTWSALTDAFPCPKK